MTSPFSRGFFRDQSKKIGLALCFLAFLGMGLGCKKKHKEELNVIPLPPPQVVISSSPTPAPVGLPTLTETVPSAETRASASVVPETVPESQPETQVQRGVGAETAVSPESQSSLEEKTPGIPSSNDSAESLPSVEAPLKGGTPNSTGTQSPASW